MRAAAALAKMAEAGERVTIQLAPGVHAVGILPQAVEQSSADEMMVIVVPRAEEDMKVGLQSG